MDPLPHQVLPDQTARPLLGDAPAKENRQPIFHFQKVGRLKQIERVQSSAGESSSPEKSPHRRRRRRVPFLQLGPMAPVNQRPLYPPQNTSWVSEDIPQVWPQIRLFSV